MNTFMNQQFTFQQFFQFGKTAGVLLVEKMKSFK